MSRNRWAAALLLAAAIAWPVAVAVGASAASTACESPTAISALDELAAGKPLAGKSVGEEWVTVLLGTVTEVRHKSPKFRYRITMAVDASLGAEVAGVYTFFGSSRGTFPFEKGSVYVVPLTRRGGSGELAPTTELWAERCDPVIAVSDLAAAREVIAKSKPGYTPTPTPSATPTPSSTPTPSEAVVEPTPLPSATVAPRMSAVPRAAFPNDRTVQRGLLTGVVGLGGVALLIVLIAVVESWWSRRRHRS